MHTLRLRKLSTARLVNLLSPRPHPLAIPLIQRQQARQQRRRVLVARLPRHQRGQVVNRHDAQLRPLRQLLLGRRRGLLKGRVRVVHGDGVVGRVGVAAHVHNGLEPARRNRQRLKRHKGRDLVRAQIHGIHKDVRLGHLLEGSPPFGLGQIPLEQRVLGDARRRGKVHRAAAAAAQGANDNHARLLAPVGGDGGRQDRLGVRNQLRRRVKGPQGGHGHVWVQRLVRPGEQPDGGARVARKVAKGGDAHAVRVGEELEVVEEAAGAVEAAQARGPAVLLLVAVLEVDVGAGEVEGLVFGELLEAEDDVVLGGLFPAAGGDNLGADGTELVNLVDALGVLFDLDGVAGVDEGLGGAGRDWSIQ